MLFEENMFFIGILSLAINSSLYIFYAIRHSEMQSFISLNWIFKNLNDREIQITSIFDEEP